MNETLDEFNYILEQEDKILDSLTVKQGEMKAAVKERNWEKLTNVVADINIIYDSFQEIDSERESVQDMLKYEELKPYFEKIGLLRSKLLKCKIENQALSKYVNITREFIQGVVENAIPHSNSTVYSKQGTIVKPQPQSVVLSIDF